MSDVKMNGVSPPVRLASTSSSQKIQGQAAEQGKGDVVKNLGQELSAQKNADQNVTSVDARSDEGQKAVESAVTKLNDYVQSVQRNLQFNLDDDSGKTIITVVDRDTSEVIRQIPDDVALKLAQDLQQSEPLSLFNVKV